MPRQFACFIEVTWYFSAPMFATLVESNSNMSTYSLIIRNISIRRLGQSTGGGVNKQNEKDLGTGPIGHIGFWKFAGGSLQFVV